MKEERVVRAMKAVQVVSLLRAIFPKLEEGSMARPELSVLTPLRRGKGYSL